jgi:hypothetical protein
MGFPLQCYSHFPSFPRKRESRFLPSVLVAQRDSRPILQSWGNDGVGDGALGREKACH